MYVDQSHLNCVQEKKVVIAVIHIGGTPCCFRTYSLGRVLLWVCEILMLMHLCVLPQYVLCGAVCKH